AAARPVRASVAPPRALGARAAAPPRPPRAADLVAKAQAVRAAAERLWSATANPDGSGLLERGREFEPFRQDAYDPVALDAVLRLARLSGRVVEMLRDCPDEHARRSAALLAARAHPVLAAFDAGS